MLTHSLNPADSCCFNTESLFRLNLMKRRALIQIMKRRALVRRDRESSSSVRPRSLLSEAPSLLSRHFLHSRLTPLAAKTPISLAERLVRRQGLDAVLPRSPSESIYAETSDREMKTALRQALRAAENSTPHQLRRPKYRSEKSLFRPQIQHPAPSDTSESLSQSPLKGRRQAGVTPSLSAETTAEEQQSVLEEYLAEVRQLKRLKRNVSKGLLTLFPRTSKALPIHEVRSLSLKRVYQREKWLKDYMGRVQAVIKRLDHSLDHY